MRVRRTLTIGGTVAVLVVGVLPGQASAVAHTADLYVEVSAVAAGADPTMVAVGDDAPFDVFIGNSGPDSVATTLTMTVSGATVTSAKPDSSIATTCTVTSATKLTCTTGPVPTTGEGAFIEVHTTPAVAGTVTATGTVSSSATDPFPDDNTSVATITASVPPPATLAATSTYSDFALALDVDAHLTRTDNGDDVAYNEVVASVRYAGSSVWTVFESDETGADGHVDLFLYGLTSGDFDVKLDHAASAQAAAASTTLHVVAPASTVTISVKPTAIGRGQSVSVTCRVSSTSSGQPVSGASLELQRRPTGTTTWHDVSSALTDSDGRAGVTDVPAQPSDYRYLHHSEIGVGASVSPVVSVAMAPTVRETLSPAVVPPGYHSTMSAQTTPRDPGAAAHLQQLKGGRWTTIHTKPVSSAGVAQWQIPTPRKGSFTYRIVVDAASHFVARIGRAVSVKVTTQGLGKASAYSFLGTYHGHPMRWNPCQVIGYKVNAAKGPAGAVAMVKETLRRIHLASGLQFRYEGHTATRPVWGVIRHQAAPMVISWITSRDSGGLLGFGGAIGYGGATESRYLGSHEVIQQGGAILLAASDPGTEGLGLGFGAGTTWGELLMHELGHAVGLDHTNGKYQIMRPIMPRLRAAMYGAGDLHGLHLIGRSQGCLP